MSRVELLSSGGLRLDNRRPYELRSVDFKILPNPPIGCDSIARVEHGLTKVEGYVCGPRDPNETNRTIPSAAPSLAPNSNAISSTSNTHLVHPQASIHVHISATPFSSIDRKKISKSDKKFADLASSIQNTFQPVILLHLYPRSSIDIFIHVIQQDGALLQSAINVTTLALIGAGVSIKDYVTSISIGAISTHSCGILDLTNNEQTDLTNLTIGVLPRTQKLTLIQLDTRINLSTFESLLHIGLDACLILHREMDREVRRWCFLRSQPTLQSFDYQSHSVNGPVLDQNPQLIPID